MKDDINVQVEERAKQLLNDLLSNVDLHKIVTIDNTHGIVFIGGVKADASRLSNLKAEAEFFLQSDLWSILCETPKELAQRAMFISSESMADLQKGKSMLYMLSVQKNIVNMFKGYIGKSVDTGSIDEKLSTS